MKLYLAQINPTIGDIEKNKKIIIENIKKARKQKADIIIFPELSICGYPPDDLLFYDSFLKKMNLAIEEIKSNYSKDILIILGAVRKEEKSNRLFNSVFAITDKKIVGIKDKSLLPDYDIFNEGRYFSFSKEKCVIDYKSKKIGVLISEDVWQCSSNITKVNYEFDPVNDLQKEKLDLVIVPSASPYYFEKLPLRLNIYKNLKEKLNAPVVFVNQVGANDELVFDGLSFILNEKENFLFLKSFEEDSRLFDLENINSFNNDQIEKIDPIVHLYSALVLGVKDYFKKQNFSKAIIGLSGGIDSALTAAIAKDALGEKNVLALRMPSRYSSISSIDDAEALVKNLSIKILDIPIDNIYQQFLNLLSPFFFDKKPDTTEENLQARIRGNILMALSNKLNLVVLTTGNKSELATGYVTLYGDMVGGLSVISDVFKTQVYDLCNYLNKKNENEIIPKSIITKAPSAELKPDQKDQDELPSYEILDNILQSYLEDHFSVEDIANKYKYEKNLIKDVINKVHKAEFKRRQGPLGIIVSRKAFGKGRSFPIVQGWFN